MTPALLTLSLIIDKGSWHQWDLLVFQSLKEIHTCDRFWVGIFSTSVIRYFNPQTFIMLGRCFSTISPIWSSSMRNCRTETVWSFVSGCNGNGRLWY